MWQIKYHHKALNDVEKLDKNSLIVIKRAIEEKVLINPLVFGKPLRKSLKNLRSVRAGRFRIIFEVKNNKITIIVILDRSISYEEAMKRVG